ncbi:hypothetical protein E4U15_005827 [Claviceps sp. LM218 group G6]|nr:hypothetical protein E4U15_005827 [Claviceps sp. LM218 group G6]
MAAEFAAASAVDAASSSPVASRAARVQLSRPGPAASATGIATDGRGAAWTTVSTISTVSRLLSPAMTPELTTACADGVDEAPRRSASQHETRARGAEPSPPLSDSLSDDCRPLRTASVRADTSIAHPRPLAYPMVLPSHPMVHPHAHPRSPSIAGSIAQLEATAERLSMTSSIDDAIRDLHTELKRSDSRRSARLALSTMASVDENSASSPPLASRRLSTRASIVSINSAARYGGYSPAGFVMSPTTSLTSRLRSSGSANSISRGDITFDSILSRHGTAKSSVRSARSGKLSLAEISESDPVSLTQQAFDEADAAPPLEHHSAEALQLTRDTTAATLQSTDAFHQMASHSSATQPFHYPYTTAPMHSAGQVRQAYRPESVHSTTTLEQARDAFVDFDGVHWEAPEDQLFSGAHHDLEPALTSPTQRTGQIPVPGPGHGSGPVPASGYAPGPMPVPMARPTSYIDPSTGTNMLYYPARVPAMLNLPPKLSSKPKAAVRDQRRSQVLSAMMDFDASDMPMPHQRRQSAYGEFGPASSPEPPVQDSWLPDPVATHRNSFAALSTLGGPFEVLEAPSVQSADEEEPLSVEQEPVTGDAASGHLRRPGRLSKAPTKRKSVMSMLSNLPSQLRASAFFDLPSKAADVEIKNGSAMATLDSILDASATAPVNAFTGHAYASTLGNETHGKQKEQNKARFSAATGQAFLTEPRPPKKRSSMMWLSKRTSSIADSREESRPHSSLVPASTHVGDTLTPTGDGRQSLESGHFLRAGVENVELRDGTSGIDGQQTEEEGAEGAEGQDGQDEIPGESYRGPPTTLLAELQLRKYQQKQRVRNMGQGFPTGNHATLLEMDTVAERQKMNRQNKRINLAWEGSDTRPDQDGSDDEDVPLAIIAAMQRGAKNLADLERPLGLMERREIEDNEPLSHRRARLQGIDPPPPPPPTQPALRERPSNMSLSGLRRLGALQPPHPEGVTPRSGSSDRSPVVGEIEEETLGDRRRRLATKEGELPKTRPVSSAFSVELLTQFGGASESEAQAKDDKKKSDGDSKKESAPDVAGEEEETLGQRRRRLQAEREARDREISLGNAAAAQPPPSQQDQDDGRRRLSLANVLSAHPKRDAANTRLQEERLRLESERRAAQDRENKMTALRKQMPTTLPQVNLERSGGFLGGALNDGTGGHHALKGAASSPALNTYGLGVANRASMLSGGAGLQQHGAASVYGAGGALGPVAVGGKSMDRVEQWRYSVRP